MDIPAGTRSPVVDLWWIGRLNTPSRWSNRIGIMSHQSIVVFAIVLFCRTVVIESGFRRPLMGAASAFEHGSRRRRARCLAIIAVEEYRADSDSKHEAADVRDGALETTRDACAPI
jgi:hypothetical protein